MAHRSLVCAASVVAAAFSAAFAPSAPSQAAGADLASAQARAAATVGRMTQAEKTVLTHGIMPIPLGPGPTSFPPDATPGAGYVPGIPRLGVPALKETDASLGVSYVFGLRKDGATALPSGVAMAATWNPDLVRQGGAMIGAEARAEGFNVLLAGGANLMRDPRNGRTFEYFSEDPLLTGVLAGSVMCAYNQVNGSPACASDWLLNKVLKRDWRYPGFVMSDWGSVSSLSAAWSGLDQQSGAQLDPQVFFDKPLAEAVAADPARRARLDDMNRRILTAIYASGLDAHPVSPGGRPRRAGGARVVRGLRDGAPPRGARRAPARGRHRRGRCRGVREGLP